MRAMLRRGTSQLILAVASGECFFSAMMHGFLDSWIHESTVGLPGFEGITAADDNVFVLLLVLLKSGI